MLNNPAVYGQAYTFDIALVDQSDTKKFKANPTLAAGDFKISKDGGALTNLASLPTVTPASGVQVRVVLSATEMTCENASVYWVDAAGAEWCDGMANIQPSGGSGVFDYGTAQAATASTIQLRSGLSLADNRPSGFTVGILSGTGAGQARQIESYVNATDTATVSPNWTTTPDSTSIYVVYFTPPGAPLAAGSFSTALMAEIVGAVRDDFIGMLLDGYTRDATSGNLTFRDSAGSTVPVPMTTDAAAQPVVSTN